MPAPETSGSGSAQYRFRYVAVQRCREVAKSQCRGFGPPLGGLCLPLVPILVVDIFDPVFNQAEYYDKIRIVHGSLGRKNFFKCCFKVFCFGIRSL